MHVLGEPLGRQLVAEPANLCLAVDGSARGGELVSEADIVKKAGDLVIRLAASGPADDQLGQRRQPLEVDLPARRPAVLAWIGRSSWA